MPIGPQQLVKLFSLAFPGLVAYVDSELRYQFVGPLFAEWYGIEPQSVLGKKIEKVIGHERIQERLANIDRALKGEEVRFFSSWPHPSLGLRQLEQIYYPDISEDGVVQGILVLATDITEKLEAEVLAKENEARFKSLTEVMPQLVWICDEEGKAIYFNENWSKVTGTKIEENLGNGWINTLHPEDRISTVLSWKDTMRLGDHFEKEYRLKMADGSFRWHVARATGIRDDKNKNIRWVGTTTDIEDQKNARDKALDERKRMYSLFMQAPVAIYMMTGPEHTFELVNEPAKKYFGNNRTLLGRTLREAIPELADQGFYELMDEVYHSGVGKVFTSAPVKLNYHGEGIQQRFADLFYEPIKDENGLTTGILNMVVDVTGQVEALKKAEEKERSLEEALVARDQFLSVASHELKTPLTSLKLQAQLTLRSLQNNREIPQERQISLAQQNSELVGRLTRLIDDMLDVSRIKTGKLKLEKSEHDLGDIVREVAFQMNVLFETAKLPLPKLEITQKMLGHWDRFRLEQVIGNLLTNAIRYGRGKPIEISLVKQANMALLSVTDFGYGINQEDRDRIFGRFERAINSSEVSGMGLGLFISKEIIESHQGRIWVDSRVDVGSTFFVELPLK